MVKLSKSRIVLIEIVRDDPCPCAAVFTRGWAADSTNTRVRQKAELDRANQELLLLREEIRIKDARGWSLEQAARVFNVTAATIASWVKRVDEQGPNALVQLREPVNKLPDFVRFVVQQLKILCPTMGKQRIAGTWACAGLHLGATAVGNILNEKPVAAQARATQRQESYRFEVAAM